MVEQDEQQPAANVKGTEGTDKNPDKTVDISAGREAENEVENKDQGESGLSGETLEHLAAKLEQAQADLAEAKEQTLRAHAELQNVRRRAQADVEKAHKFALDKFVESLLPVVDSLERGMAMEVSENGADAMKEGMKLTLKLLIDTLQKFNVEQLCPEGEPFNPEHHQAVSQLENPDVERGSVINVFQKGYLLNGRLVRPATVTVSK